MRLRPRLALFLALTGIPLAAGSVWLRADLERRADELQPRIFLGPRTRVAMGWFVDNAASIVMLGFIALMVLSCVSG